MSIDRVPASERMSFNLIASRSTYAAKIKSGTKINTARYFHHRATTSTPLTYYLSLDKNSPKRLASAGSIC
jgi:hypothetical protein